MERKESGRQTAMNLTQGPPLRLILAFSLPMLVGNVFQQLYNVVDSMVVGNYVGAWAMAAVGLCAPLVYLTFSIFVGIGTGASVLVSQFQGAEDRAGVQSTIQTSYVCILLGGVPLTILGILLSRHVLRLINVPDDLLGPSTLYLRIYFLGAISSLGFNINDGILRGLGDSRSSLRFLSVACGVNILLDFVFVLAFHWGVAGVAVATVISQLCAWLLSMRYIERTYMEMGKRLFKPQFDRQIAGQILRIGVPSGIQHSVFALGVVTMQSLINGFGPDFIAGFNAASKIDSFAFMPIQSFTVALTSYVGQNIGARRFDRLHTGMVQTIKASLILDAILISIIYFTSTTLLSLFNREPAVISAGMSYLVRILPFYFLLTLTSLLEAVLRGAGDTLLPTVITFVALWMGRVPSAYLFAHFFGKENIFFCYGVGWIIELILLGLYYGSGRWKRRFLN